MAVVLTVKFQQKALAITLAGQPLKSQQTGGRPGTGGRHCRSLVELGTRPCRLPDMCYCEEEKRQVSLAVWNLDAQLPDQTGGRLGSLLQTLDGRHIVGVRRLIAAPAQNGGGRLGWD